ncbi:MAG: IclR family transcriptional regulator [Sciscionella sp.]
MSETPPDMVGKALLLLTLLGEHPEGATLSELARQADFPVSTTHRLAAALVRDGYAVVDDSRRYNLGLRVFSLASRIAHARGFAGSALPVLRGLAAQTTESALMSVLSGRHQLYIHHVEGTHTVSVVGEPGRHGPLHCTSMGKVLIAFAPDPVRHALLDTLDLPPLGPNTITNRSRFHAEIQAVRDRGYAVADEEHEAGIRAIGVPVTSEGGSVLAAISVAAPAYRVSLDQLTEYLPDLTRAAEQLRVLLPAR